MTTNDIGNGNKIEIAILIPQDIVSHVFEQFFTTKDVGKGTGLGLSISYRIVVEMHKGDISFNSKPGDTRFEVRLPLKNDQ